MTAANLCLEAVEYIKNLVLQPWNNQIALDLCWFSGKIHD